MIMINLDDKEMFFVFGDGFCKCAIDDCGVEKETEFYECGVFATMS